MDLLKTIALSFVFLVKTSGFASIHTLETSPTSSEAARSIYDEVSPGISKVLEVAFTALKKQLKDLKLNSSIKVNENKIRINGISKLSCYKPNVVLEAFSLQVVDKGSPEGFYLSEGIKIYSCGSHIETLVLNRWGQNLKKTSFEDLLAGEFPLYTNERSWGFRKYDMKKSLVALWEISQVGEKISSELQVYFTNGSYQFQIEEFNSSTKMQRNYQFGFSNMFSTKSSSFLSQNGESTESVYWYENKEVSLVVFTKNLNIFFNTMSTFVSNYVWEFKPWNFQTY